MSIENKNQITSLPLDVADLKEFLKVANEKFDDVLETIKARHPALVRKTWKPEDCIIKALKPDMLPLDRNYALSLLEDFLVRHVIELTIKADDQAVRLN